MKTLKQLRESWEEHNNLSQHYSNFNETHKKAIKEYTNRSQEINHAHWTGDTAHIKDLTKHLDSAIKKHKTPHSLEVYSGTAHDPRKIKDHNDIVHHPAFLSTSLKDDVAHDFAIYNKKFNKEYHKGSTNHILNIHVPAEHPGAYVGHHSEYTHQQEFILPRNTKLKYLHTEKTHTYGATDNLNMLSDYERTDKKNSVHIHHMEVVK